MRYMNSYIDEYNLHFSINKSWKPEVLTNTFKNDLTSFFFKKDKRPEIHEIVLICCCTRYETCSKLLWFNFCT